jgi:hypothetical protein
MTWRLGAGLLSAALTMWIWPEASGAQQWRDHQLLLKVGDKSFSYTSDQLKTMATAEFVSWRGSKRNAAIPLPVFLTKDTKLTPDRISGVNIVGTQKVMLIEGDRLKSLDGLVLKFGPNHLTLAPINDETAAALRPLWGKPRIEDVVRIDIIERR